MKKIILSLGLLMLMSLGVSAQKFAFIDSEYILENIPEYQAAQKQLDQMSIQWQKEIEAQFSEIEKLYKDYQAESMLLPDDVRKTREEAIVAKEKQAKDLQKQRFGRDGDLFKKRQELIKPIQDKMYEAIKEVSEKGSYAIVFDKSGGVTMVYTDVKFDLSDEILNKMGYRK
ncbi:MAG: OmpH family outer membrane protein [Bacteroidales bacterium]|nr:OmpH family outer membrane protein [Bacteroidales bacterium]